MANKNWTRDETIVAFNVYCKIPFKSSSKSNPIVIKYANIIGRSPSALNMKIGNFGRLDPDLQKKGISGLTHGSKMEEEVWEEFNGDWDKLAFESEQIIANFQNKDIANFEYLEVSSMPSGLDRHSLVKTRVNQSFFRSTVLASYDLKCCITGLSNIELLVASHIVPWSEDEKNRTNPHNGLCLNSLHDRAFDKGLITILPNYRIQISHVIQSSESNNFLNYTISQYSDKEIILPERFLPSKDFLDYHNQNIFIS